MRNSYPRITRRLTTQWPLCEWDYAPTFDTSIVSLAMSHVDCNRTPVTWTTRTDEQDVVILKAFRQPSLLPFSTKKDTWEQFNRITSTFSVACCENDYEVSIHAGADLIFFHKGVWRGKDGLRFKKIWKYAYLFIQTLYGAKALWQWPPYLAGFFCVASYVIALFPCPAGTKTVVSYPCNNTMILKHINSNSKHTCFLSLYSRSFSFTCFLFTYFR